MRGLAIGRMRHVYLVGQDKRRVKWSEKKFSKCARQVVLVGFLGWELILFKLQMMGGK